MHAQLWGGDGMEARAFAAANGFLSRSLCPRLHEFGALLEGAADCISSNC